MKYKWERRDKKKRPKMRVQGRSVFRIKEILKERAQKLKSPE